jgi:hypothetical protein
MGSDGSRIVAMPLDHTEGDVALAAALCMALNLGGIFVAWLIEDGPAEAAPGLLPDPD